MLRKRLASYYENEGRHSRLRIDLPRGGYVPTFTPVEVDPLPETAVVVLPPAAEPPRSAPRSSRRLFIAGIATGVLLFGLAVALIWMVPTSRTVPGPAVWRDFVHPGTESIVSFGVPLFYGGRDVFARDTRVNKTSDEARGRLAEIEEAIGGKLVPQEDVYTGIGDLVGTHEVVRWLESYGVKTRLANSHYLGHSDIAEVNLVVVSSARFQTLLSEMPLPRPIDFQEQGGGFRVDQPGPGEQAFYYPSGGTGVDTSYAVISLWPGKRNDIRILYLSGITTWATQGAAQYLVDRDKLQQLQTRLDADPPKGQHGKRSGFFQVLVRVEGKNNRVRTAEYVTHRYCP
jgi:hypothetical protein